MTKLLTLKHWQFVGLLLGLPMIFQFVGIDSIMSGSNPNKFFITSSIMMIFFIGFFSAWFYALGTNLHKKLPATVTMNLTRFKIFLFIPVVYMLFFLVFFSGMFSIFAKSVESNISIFAVIFPLYLLSMFCIFYCLYFIAKALKTVEWQKPVTFSDFAREFFLILFFPLGVWIIQPRINKLFDPTVGENNNQIVDHNV